MNLPRAIVLVVLALVASPHVGALRPIEHDDAETARDAGDSAADPLELAPGSYGADLIHFLGDDEDRFHTTGCAGISGTIAPFLMGPLHIVAYSDAGGAPFVATSTGDTVAFVLYGDSYTFTAKAV